MMLSHVLLLLCALAAVSATVSSTTTCGPVPVCSCDETHTRTYFRDSNNCWQCYCAGPGSTGQTSTTVTTTSRRTTSSRSTTTTTTTTTTTATTTISTADKDVAILNFALNLEYLEAEFYLAAVGRKPSYENDVHGVVTGGKAVNFTSQAMRDYALEIAQDEENHVLFLRQVLGNKAVDRPNLNIGGGPTGAFGVAAATAGKLAGVNNATQQALSNFSPYASELFFLHGAFIFEDVGVTAYKGAAPIVTNKSYLAAAAGILAVEAYHAATVRTLLYNSKDVVAVPASNGTTSLRVKDIVAAISNLRATLGNGKDQSIVNGNNSANLVPTDSNSIAYGRTPREVLNIVYGAVNANKGLFFPNGLNGNFASLL